MPRHIHLARIPADAATARRIANLLFENLDTPGSSVAAFEVPQGWVVEAQFLRPPNRERLASLIRTAAGEAPLTIEYSEVPARDWVASSLEALRPVRVGRFAVHGAHARAALAPAVIGIEIEAALAFGTGHHGTTQGCLRAIERAARTRRPRRILDVGTGTGVLAIAAARAMRRPVIAGEVDPIAVAVARANVRTNRSGAYVRVVHAEGTRHPAIRCGSPYGLVLANILLGPVQRLARPVRPLLAPRAKVVLSGLLTGQANAALAAWRAQGLVLERCERIDGWATLTLARPTRPSEKRGARPVAWPGARSLQGTGRATSRREASRTPRASPAARPWPGRPRGSGAHACGFRARPAACAPR